LDDWRQLADQAVKALWAPDLAANSDRQCELADLIDSLRPTLDDYRHRIWVLLAERLRSGTGTAMQDELPRCLVQLAANTGGAVYGFVARLSWSMRDPVGPASRRRRGWQGPRGSGIMNEMLKSHTSTGMSSSTW
jgi:hypothetical protein